MGAGGGGILAPHNHPPSMLHPRPAVMQPSQEVDAQDQVHGDAGALVSVEPNSFKNATRQRGGGPGARHRGALSRGGTHLHSVYDEQDAESEAQLDKRIERRRVAASAGPVVQDMGEVVEEETVGRFFLAQMLAQTAAKLLRVPASEAVYEYKQMSDHVSWRCSGHFIRKIEAFYLRKYLLAIDGNSATDQKRITDGTQTGYEGVSCWAVPFICLARAMSSCWRGTRSLLGCGASDDGMRAVGPATRTMSPRRSPRKKPALPRDGGTRRGTSRRGILGKQSSSRRGIGRSHKRRSDHGSGGKQSYGDGRGNGREGAAKPVQKGGRAKRSDKDAEMQLLSPGRGRQDHSSHQAGRP